MINIFVGNLPYQTTEEDLQAAFAEFGPVDRVSVVRDRETGKSRGFAFVEMANGAEASRAINALNGMEMNGRAIKVNEARPREDRAGSGGGGGGGSRARNGGAGGGRSREPRW